MATSRESDFSSSGQMLEVPDCSICLEPYKEPKVLPTCGHTFCLRCLEQYGVDCDAGDKVNCPECREEFQVPLGGFNKLPANYSIIKLTNLISKSSIKHSRNHQMANEPSRTSCKQHPNKEIEFYCFECKITTCVVCYKAKHVKHKCADVEEAPEEFGKQLKNDTRKLTSYIVMGQDELKQIKENKESLMSKVKAIKDEATKKYSQLRSLLESHWDQLINDLDSYQAKALKELETRKDEVEAQVLSLETFKRYFEEIGVKGSSLDINLSHQADDMHARTEELVKTQGKLLSSKRSLVDITFTPATATTRSTDNWIGQLKFQRTEQHKKVNKLTKDKQFSSTSFLQQSTVAHVIPGKDKVSGVAVIGSQVCISRHLIRHIEVYDTRITFTTLTHHLKISDQPLIRPRLAACLHYKYLYARHYSSQAESVIYRVELSNNNTVTSWTVKGSCRGLSATNNYNLLITLCVERRVLEYTADGSLIRAISLDSSIDDPLNCIQLSDGHFVVCHKGLTQQRVCIVGASGQILCSYGGAKGSDVRQLNCPCHLSVDSNNNVFVADYFNDRVQLLSPTLSLVGTVQTPGHKLLHPAFTYIDEINKHLYVVEESGCLLVLTATL